MPVDLKTKFDHQGPPMRYKCYYERLPFLPNNSKYMKDAGGKITYQYISHDIEEDERFFGRRSLQESQAGPSSHYVYSVKIYGNDESLYDAELDGRCMSSLEVWDTAKGAWVPFDAAASKKKRKSRKKKRESKKKKKKKKKPTKRRRR